MPGQQSLGVRAFGPFRRIQHRIRQQAFAVTAVDVFGGGWPGPGHTHPRRIRHLLGTAALRVGDDQHRNALPPGPSGAAAAVQKRLGIGRQVGMHHQIQRRQIEASRGNISAHAHPRTPRAQRIQRRGTLMLAEFAGQHHGGKPTLHQ